MKKLVVLCLCAAMAAAMPLSSVAIQATETTETSEEVKMKEVSFEDGILIASVPEDESWQEITDDDSCITISDGANTIIFNHYSTPDDLPQVASYDSTHEMAYEIAYSKSDVSITIVAKITHTSDYAEVKDIMDSINIDVTKLDEEHQKTHHATNEYTIKEVNYTAWVKSADGLCIREEGDTSANFKTLAPYASKLTVIGEVQSNGVDNGWRKVTTSDGVTGFCAGQFLSTTEITPSSSSSTNKNSDSAYSDPSYPWSAMIYTGDFNTSDHIYIYLVENGTYSDKDGNVYTPNDSTFNTFTRESDGVNFNRVVAAVEEDSDSDAINVKSEEGDERTLTHSDSDEAGVYRDEYGNTFTQTDAGVWHCEEEDIYYYE